MCVMRTTAAVNCSDCGDAAATASTVRVCACVSCFWIKSVCVCAWSWLQVDRDERRKGMKRGEEEKKENQKAKSLLPIALLV